MSKVCLAVGQFIILIIIRLFIDLEKGTSLPHNALRMFANIHQTILSLMLNPPSCRKPSLNSFF